MDHGDLDNPWTESGILVPSTSESRLNGATRPSDSAVDLASDPLVFPVDHSIRGSTSDAFDKVLTSPQAGATRPSLSRLTSSSGLISTASTATVGPAFPLQGLERLALANLSQDSLSTDGDGAYGQRRSLEEIRRLSMLSGGGKGKGRAIGDLAGVLENTLVQAPGFREALHHPVEKDDTLIKIALLYGCTVQAIRSANKLWVSDSIQLRKFLFIPLDSCTQPPSREVEFVQTVGEDSIQLYLRRSSAFPTDKGTTLPHSRSFSAKSQTQAIAHQARLSLDYEYPKAYRDDDGEYISSNRSSISQPVPLRHPLPVSYITATNLQYTSDNASVFAPSRTESVTSGGGVSVSPSVGSPGFARPPSHLATRTEKRVIKIVQMPGLAPAASVSQPKQAKQATNRSSPLVTLDSDNESQVAEAGKIPRNASLLPSLDTSVPPLTSHDRLASLSGNSPNLRLRPRTPIQGLDTPDNRFQPTSRASLDSQLDTKGQGGNGQGGRHPVRPSAFPQRQRKVSKEAVPRSIVPANSASSSNSGQIGNYISAGAGLLSSLLGTSNGTGPGSRWLAPDEEEMQLARDYRTKRQASKQPIPSLHSRSVTRSKSIADLGNGRERITS